MKLRFQRQALGSGWDRRNRADLIESATPCHDAQGGSRRGDGFAVSSCFWDGLTVFGSKNDGFTVLLFLNGFQISSQNLIRAVKLSEIEIKATNKCPLRYNFVNILLTSPFPAYLGHHK